MQCAELTMSVIFGMYFRLMQIMETQEVLFLSCSIIDS